VAVKKDTQKVDKLKSMQQAWEVAQPGRCKEAQDSRQKFLEVQAIKEEKTNDEETTPSSMAESTPPPSNVPRPNVGPVKIRQMDLTPFFV